MSYNEVKSSYNNFLNKRRVWEQTGALYNLIMLPWSRCLWGRFYRPGWSCAPSCLTGSAVLPHQSAGRELVRCHGARGRRTAGAIGPALRAAMVWIDSGASDPLTEANVGNEPVCQVASIGNCRQ